VIVASSRIGRETRLATASGLSSASRLGTSSPRTDGGQRDAGDHDRERDAARVPFEQRPLREPLGEALDQRGFAKAPLAMPMTVMPSCTVARKLLGDSASASATCATAPTLVRRGAAAAPSATRRPPSPTSRTRRSATSGTAGRAIPWFDPSAMVRLARHDTKSVGQWRGPRDASAGAPVSAGAVRRRPPAAAIGIAPPPSLHRQQPQRAASATASRITYQATSDAKSDSVRNSRSSPSRIAGLRGRKAPVQSPSATRVPCSIARLASSSAATSAPPISLS
jgi:hypothetical protein